jgi:hypothetical protein
MSSKSFKIRAVAALMKKMIKKRKKNLFTIMDSMMLMVTTKWLLEIMLGTGMK